MMSVCGWPRPTTTPSPTPPGRRDVAAVSPSFLGRASDVLAFHCRRTLRSNLSVFDWRLPAARLCCSTSTDRAPFDRRRHFTTRWPQCDRIRVMITRVPSLIRQVTMTYRYGDSVQPTARQRLTRCTYSTSYRVCSVASHTYQPIAVQSRRTSHPPFFTKLK